MRFKKLKFYTIKISLLTIFVISLFLIILHIPNSIQKTKDKYRPLADNSHSAAAFPSTSIGDIECKKKLWPKPEETLLSLGITSKIVALDLCCGDGYFTIPLSKITFKTYGLELDPALLEKAHKEAVRENIENCCWVQGDARNAKTLLPEKVDFVLLANTFHGVPEKQELIKSIFSILKSDGKLAIINWHRKPKEETFVIDHNCGPEFELRMSPQEVRKVVESEGFILKKTIDFPPHHYGMVFEKQVK